MVGYGTSGDGYHITHPHPSGQGAALAMQSAIRQSDSELHDIVYINAHATSTPIGQAGNEK